jgi:hypothetical protein
MIESIHPTLSRDVYGHGTDGIISVKEMDGSFGPVVERLIRTSVCVRTPNVNLKRMLWCSIFFDENVAHFRPIFFTKEGVAELLR